MITIREESAYVRIVEGREQGLRVPRDEVHALALALLAVPPGERRPCKGWREPLTAGGAAYYCDAPVGEFGLQAFRPGPGAWSWDVRSGGGHVLARSAVPCTTLAAAQLAAEDAAVALLLAALGELRR